MSDAQQVKQFDHNDPKRNMFGLLPCPECGGRHRYPTQSVHPTHPNAVLCDDCGLAESFDPKVRAQEERS